MRSPTSRWPERAPGTSPSSPTAGFPSILVPYPHATENHQEANARELVSVGAAELALDADLSSEPLARRILALVDDDERRTTMAAAALAWATPDADQRLADLVHEVGR